MCCFGRAMGRLVGLDMSDKMCIEWGWGYLLLWLFRKWRRVLLGVNGVYMISVLSVAV